MTIAQRRIKGAWEKENFGPETFIDTTGMDNDENASLRGWFNKVSICALLQVANIIKQCPIDTRLHLDTGET